MAVIEAEQLRAKTNRKREHTHAAPARDQEVTELMKENDDGEHEEKRNDVAGEPPTPGADMRKNIHYVSVPA